MLDFDEAHRRVDRCATATVEGSVTKVGELSVEARLPGARRTDAVVIVAADGRSVQAEVVSCEGDVALLSPLGATDGLGPGDPVRLERGERTIPCGNALRGRVIDPLGTPIDGRPLDEGLVPWPVTRPAPDPLLREPVRRPLVTGVRSIDGCLTLGRGQRVGLFAGPGAGKSTLLGTLARHAAADVTVICLVGERGREVREFLDDILGEEGLAGSVVVLAGAEAPAMVRARALETATAVAEHFRARGDHVLLLVDSLTRAVRARRDIALAMGEPPARGGFPASSFSALPRILERAGCDREGSITAIYAVLTTVEDDPVAEEARSLLDGHIVLSPRLGSAGHWPAVDVVESVSRVMDGVTDESHRLSATALRRMLAAHRHNEDLILMGAYRRGSCRDTDSALDRMEGIRAFLRQDREDSSTYAETLSALERLTGVC